MRVNRKKQFLMALFSAAALVVAGCVGVAASEENNPEETAADRTLVVASSADAQSLDPALANEGFSALINAQLYETLVTRDEDMNFIPGLATEWRRVDDYSYEFTLREGVVFHNGDIMTADDVAFSILRALDSAIARPILGVVDPEKVEIVDEHTIRIGSFEPFAPLLANLGHSTAFIVSQAAVESAGADFIQNPVGTGPFAFENWNRGETIELVRHDAYHGDLPQVAGIQFRIISEAPNRIIELETGGVDMAFHVSPADVRRIDEHENMTLVRRETLLMQYIGINTEVVTDVRVRQALNYGIDVDLILATILEGVGRPAIGPMGTNIPGAPQDVEAYGFNPEKARELLEEAGYGEGLELTLYTSQNTDHVNIAQAVANQLGEIGIALSIQSLEQGTFIEAINHGTADLFVHTWTTVTGDPDYAVFPLLHSSQHGSSGNRTFFANDEIDALMEEARQTFDEGRRAELYREISIRVTEEAPWIFLNAGEWLVATRSDVHGYVPRLNGQQRLDTVYFSQ